MKGVSRTHGLDDTLLDLVSLLIIVSHRDGVFGVCVGAFNVAVVTLLHPQPSRTVQDLALDRGSDALEEGIQRSLYGQATPFTRHGLRSRR